LGTQAAILEVTVDRLIYYPASEWVALYTAATPVVPENLTGDPGRQNQNDRRNRHWFVTRIAVATQEIFSSILPDTAHGFP
jgi:hypothetical protein